MFEEVRVVNAQHFVPILIGEQRCPIFGLTTVLNFREVELGGWQIFDGFPSPFLARL
jgi:hypothetical protein